MQQGIAIKLVEVDSIERLKTKETVEEIKETTENHPVPSVIFGYTANRNHYILKQVIDTLVSVVLLLLLLPVLVVVAIAIKLESPGPVVFVQKRVGTQLEFRGKQAVWKVRTFNFYKFRSMYQSSDESLHEQHIKAYVTGKLELVEGDAAQVKLKNDPRITRVGRFIRKTSLDELPQLLNVIKGDMSLVGPRPVPVYEFEAYRHSYHNRLTAKQGITGWWQVYGRGRVTCEEQIKMDIEYTRKQGLILDFKLLMLTFLAAVGSKGAR